MVYLIKTSWVIMNSIPKIIKIRPLMLLFIKIFLNNLGISLEKKIIYNYFDDFLSCNTTNIDF